MNWKNIAVGVTVIVVAVVAGLYFSGKLKLKSGFQGGKDQFTMYYAQWCPHCKTAKPEFEKLVGQSPMKVGDKSITVRMLEQGEDAAGEMKEKKVSGFPTFLLETADGNTIEYKGERTTEGFLKFLNTTLGGNIS
jgi:thiol-disulfide isomerase/thioredoxin